MGAFEQWQKRRMNVDESALEAPDELVVEQPHVTGEADNVGFH
jgi:hypothetical protein